jgi:hypothetical protein
MDPNDGNTVPYELRQVQLTIANWIYSALAAPLHDSTSIDSITAAFLQLDDQKNGKKGEVIGHAATTDPLLCPAKALGRIALGHQQWFSAHSDPDNPPGSQKLYKHVDLSGKWHKVSNHHVTDCLRKAAAHVYDITRIPPKLIGARSMRPGGGTALLCTGVDADTIKLVGHWKSDSMLLCLRAQALVVGERFAQKMLNAGRYTFAPMALQSDPLSFPQDVTPAVDGIRQLFAASP